MTSISSSAAPAGGGSGSKVTPQNAHSESVKEKKDLASWWKNFKRSDKKGPEQASPQGIFGVPLKDSIRYANVAISLFNEEGQSYIYGYVPIVVAKCGVYLKEKATDVEGIFRLAGSEKRIKELKAAFDSPDRYGKGLDWTGYTVHDAANILRRYFNQLPEPIIPLDNYQKFRYPLKDFLAQSVGINDHGERHAGESPGNHDHAIVATYQKLITELPPLNRQLLLYILDLLAVFASKSDLNKMTTANLAAIFQPGILNHPQHDMAPQEYRLSQDVLVFLIDNQDSFLIGMAGTGADDATLRDVESGSPVKSPGSPTTPNRSKTVVGRSGSSSSVAAESVRKWGSIRRNVSVSSKHSKRSDIGTAPATPTQPTAASGVHRSNTLPSRRNGSTLHSPRMSRDKGVDSPLPSPGTPAIKERPVDDGTTQQGSLQTTPLNASHPELPLVSPQVVSASSSEVTTPLAQGESTTSSALSHEYQTPTKDIMPLLTPLAGTCDKPADRVIANPASASSDRKFLGILKQSPVSDGEGRKPNKLQKKRIPGSAISSAQSSTHSLNDESRDGAQRSPMSPKFGPSSTGTILSEKTGGHPAVPTSQIPTVPMTPQRNPTDATLKPTISPSTSYASHTDDTSDADLVGDDMPTPATESGSQEKKKSRWRFSRANNRVEPSTGLGNPLGTLNSKDQTTSRSTIASVSKPRRSFQETGSLGSVAADPAITAATQAPTHTLQSSTTEPVFSDSEREKKGLLSRLRDRIRDGKDRESEKRSRTPERGHDRSKSKQDLRLPSEGLPVRGPSIEQQRAAPPASQSQSVPLEAPTAAPVAEYTMPSSGAQIDGTSTNVPDKISIHLGEQ